MDQISSIGWDLVVGNLWILAPQRGNTVCLLAALWREEDWLSSGLMTNIMEHLSVNLFRIFRADREWKWESIKI